MKLPKNFYTKISQTAWSCKTTILQLPYNRTKNRAKAHRRQPLRPPKFVVKKRIHCAANTSFYVETALFLIVNSGTSGLVLSYHVAAFSCTTLVTTLIFLNFLCNENHLNSFNFKFKKCRLTMKATQDLFLWLINFCFLDKKYYVEISQ